MFSTREVRRTERGTRCAILQDNSGFHVTLQNNENIIYECFNQLKDINELNDNITRLEDELLGK